MTKSSSSCVLLILMLICILDIVLTTDVLITRLIHQHSIYSPLSETKDLIEASLSRNKASFLVRLEVGTNHVEQHLIMDTGSSLLWINCEPCVLSVPEPVYNPKTSSSYRIGYCNDSKICYGLGKGCDASNRCAYNVHYTRLYSEGHMARETFRFGGSEAKNFTDIMFGCSRRTSSLSANGVFGLSQARISFLSQVHSSKFSYCIGNISDRSYPHHTLLIGNEIELLGDQTPMIGEGKYFVTLQSITVGEVPLDIDPQIFKMNTSDYTGGMVIDSGTTYSYLPRQAVTKLEQEIDNVIDQNLIQNLDIMYQDKYTMLCYVGVITRDLQGFPTVEFKFQDDAIMEFTAENMFRQMDDNNFCLNVLPSDIEDLQSSLLGNLMQQFYYVAYDLKEKKVAFERMECDVIGDYWF